MVIDVRTYVRSLMPMICTVVSFRITISAEIKKTTNNGENFKRMDLGEKRIATGS